MASSTKEEKMKRIGQVDIAEKSGVSIATVSRVLSGKADVSPELYARVQEAASEMGYKAARSRKTNGKNFQVGGIGLLMDLPNVDSIEEFQNRFLVGVESMANELKKPLIVASYRDDVTNNRCPLMLEQGLVSGLILKDSGSLEGGDEWLRNISQQVPTVVMMRRFPDHDICSVECDNAGAMRQAIRHLRSLGHVRIGFFSVNDLGMSRNYLHHERFNAFCMHAADLGVELNDGSIQVLDRDWDKEDLPGTARRAMDNWMTMGGKRPTAIICATDVYGIALLEDGARRGLRLPEDLSVVGVMNTVACEHSQPALTSIALSAQEMGRAAMELLENQIRNSDAPTRHVIVSTRLVERSSCAPCK